MKTKKLPRVLSLKIAKKPRHGILVYATVQSRSRRLVHTVTATSHGRSLRFHCSCEHKSFNPRAVDAHIAAVSVKLARRGYRTFKRAA